MRDYATQRAEAHLEDLVARLGKYGVTATTLLKIGVPVDEINQAIDDHGVDLVVMGTHGRTGLRHLVAGSVTERVVRSSRVPVLTIRHAG
jgi:nucleotide-binding universal stress UspA family protein